MSLEIKLRYQQPQNIKDVEAPNPVLRFHLTLKAHHQRKYEATQRHKFRKSYPYKKVPYHD